MQIIDKKKIAIISIVSLLVVAIMLLILFNPFSTAAVAKLEVISGLGVETISPKRLMLQTPLTEKGFCEITSDDTLKLEYCKEYNVFRITNLVTGQVWVSAYTDKGIEDLNGRERRLLAALLSVGYKDSEGNENTVSSTDSSVMYSYNSIENGIEVVFEFTEQGFVIPLQIYLSQGGFYASIPNDEIKEESKDYFLLSVDVLPSFGALMSGDNGYLVYPDGCGTIFDCKNTSGKKGVVSADVYAKPFSADAKKQNDIQIPLPYFGSINTGVGGFSGYILSGSQNSKLSVSIGNETLPINRIYPTAIYRYSMVSKNSKEAEFTVLTDRITDADFCVYYGLLDSRNASYSDIANSVRTIMDEYDLLPENNVGKDIPLYIELLLGAKSSVISKSGLYAMTSYEQANDIIKQLNKQTENELYVNLLGWQKEGFEKYPSNNKFSTELGSVSELRDLLSLSNKQNTIFLQTDYIKVDQGSKNFSKREDIIYDKFDHAIISQDGNSYLRNIRVAYNKLLSDMDFFKKNSVNGIAFESFSDYNVADFSDGRATTLNEAVNFYKAFLKATSNANFFTASQGGNDYLLRDSDFVYNIPDSSSQLYIWTQDIPLLQMILHGKIKYAGSLPGNMSSDYRECYLKWVETGSIPYFLLTYQSSTKFQDTYIQDIYNSGFADWQESVVNVSKEFNDSLSIVVNKTIISHESISEGVVCVSYENNYKVYVNYLYEDFIADGITVPARDFIIVK